MTFFEGSKQKTYFSNDDFFYYLTVVIGSLTFGLICYWLLPLMGFDVIAQIMSFQHICMLSISVVGGLSYLLYLKKIVDEPTVLFYVVSICFFPIYLFFLAQLKSAGIPIRIIMVIAATISVPTLLIAYRPFLFLWKCTPHFKYFIIFYVVMITYSFLNNANAIDYRALKDAASYMPLANSNICTMMNFLCMQLVVGAAMLKARNWFFWFERYNILLIVTVMIYAITAIIFYPFHLFTVSLADGLPREGHIFGHPNIFSHYMAFMVLYLGGIFFYYKERGLLTRKYAYLLLATTVVAFLAMLTGLSKTAISGVFISGIPLFFLNYWSSNNKDKRILPFGSLLFYGLLTLGILFPVLKVTGLYELISGRFGSNSSLDWRFEQWGKLVQDIEGTAILLGHGFTSAVIRIEQLTYNVFRMKAATVESPYVHNVFIEHLYDFGIIGLTWLLGILLLVKDCFVSFFKPQALAGEKSISILIICLTLFFLLGCMVDEMFNITMYPYWFTITILCLIRVRIISDELKE